MDREGGSFDSFGNFRGFGSGMMTSIFGGRDPFDDPFFTRPFGSMFDSGMFGSYGPIGDSPNININRSKGPVIEELNTDDKDEEDEEGGDNSDADKKKDSRKDAGSSKNPLVEHPDDQVDGDRKTNNVLYNKVEGTHPQMRSVSFKKVTYGGINGAYYTATTTQRKGSDGVVLEESKQANKTTGQATHRISRGIHDKGHSVTRKLNSDGNVDTMQALHNLNEDELGGFEQAWKGNAERHLPGWDDGFNLQRGEGASGSGPATRGGWALPFAEFSGRAGGLRPYNEAQTSYSSGGRPKKVVTINIE